MALRVSLQIDGDAKGAEEAAAAATRAVGDLGKASESASKGLEAGFDKAAGKAGGLANATKAAGAANDNTAASALGLAAQLDQVAQKALGSESALSKVSAGAVNIAKGIGGLSLAGGTIGLISGALGIAVTVASTFYALVNSGAAESNKRLEESARIVGVVREAYSGASRTAGEFLTTTRNITLLQAQQNLLALEADRLQTARSFLDKNKPTDFGQFSGSIPGEPGLDNGLTGALFPDQANEKLKAFSAAFDALKASVSAGAPDFSKFRDDVAAIGNAAQASNPQLAALAAGILKTTQSEADKELATKRVQAAIAQQNGTATEQQRKLLGISDAARDTTNEFDRMVKSMQRQAAAQEAEAAATGKSVGESAKLRAQYLLTEAATQANIKVTGDYAEKLNLVSTRLGEAAQKSALMRLQSDLNFEQGQFGRTASEASVADRLRGVYGDNVSGAMSGATADLIRFNDQMRELKGVSIEVAQGAFRDFRTELQNGATAWEAFGRAGVNALGRIADKLADKALDSIVTRIFGSFLGGGGGGATGGTGLSLTGTGGLFASGGYTGDGATYEPAGIVHKGEIVWSQSDIGRAGGVDVVEGMRRGLRGYADGGYVEGTSLARGTKALNGSTAMTPPISMIDNRVMHVGAGASQDTVIQLRAELEHDRAQRYYQVVEIVKQATGARDL